MKYVDEKLKKRQYKELWDEYCGFLDLDIKGYMCIQNRLALEQINLWCKSKLGQSILKGKMPQTIEEFRSMVPLTSYEDYADILLLKREDMLPDKPLIWIQTTWEGGRHPIKLAPYTRSMLDTFRNNVVTTQILSTTVAKGQFTTRINDKILYGFAPLPYTTGLVPITMLESVSVDFLPPVEMAVDLSFSQRNKEGFKMAMHQGVDIFFGLGSVAHAVSIGMGSMKNSGGFSSLFQCTPKMALKVIWAKYKCKQENRPLKPKDLFKLKGFLVAGTDNKWYKDDLEDLWGVRPMELFAGTEPSFIGTESWIKDGMYFFPDTCFYEFIIEKEMLKSLADSSYIPHTYLMDEVIPGEKYELVVTVLKGGAFARYRVGDVYRCLGVENKEDGTKIPRFEYIDRIPTIIDICGFTRISEKEIQNVIELSGLAIHDWIACKEIDAQKRPFLHIYLELKKEQIAYSATTQALLREQLSNYFRYIDQDYCDLKKLLGVDPMEITILACGTFNRYQAKYKSCLPHMNPSSHDIAELLKMQYQSCERKRVE